MTQQADQLTVNQLLWALAGAKESCPCLSHLQAGGPFCCGVGDHRSDCHECKGTGQVYVLPDNMRDSCSPWKENFVVIGHIARNAAGAEWPVSPDECACHGLGYVPSRSLKVWMEARSQLHLRHARLTGSWKHFPFMTSEWWVATYPCPVGEHEHEPFYRPEEATCLKGEAVEPLDAVLRALVVALETQGVQLDFRKKGPTS